jgi:hypothetical protein
MAGIDIKYARTTVDNGDIDGEHCEQGPSGPFFCPCVTNLRQRLVTGKLQRNQRCHHVTNVTNGSETYAWEIHVRTLCMDSFYR